MNVPKKGTVNVRKSDDELAALEQKKKSSVTLSFKKIGIPSTMNG